MTNNSKFLISVLIGFLIGTGYNIYAPNPIGFIGGLLTFVVIWIIYLPWRK